MQSRVDSFINDFYAELDGRAATKAFVAQFFTEEAVLSHFGEVHRGAENIENWFDGVKACFSESFHQIKEVQSKQFDDVLAVQADAVWMASFRNMDGDSRIRYKAVVRMDLVDDDGVLRIKNYKSVAL